MSLLLESMDLGTLEIDPSSGTQQGELLATDRRPSRTPIHSSHEPLFPNDSLAPTHEELLTIRCPLDPNVANCDDRVTEEHDWFELALKTEAPANRPIRNSWGEDEEESDEEIPEDGSREEEEEADPFEDFDEEDFDDDFDDDFEEELEDEYEIEPKDDGFALEEGGDDSDEDLDDDGEGIPEDVD